MSWRKAGIAADHPARSWDLTARFELVECRLGGIRHSRHGSDDGTRLARTSAHMSIRMSARMSIHVSAHMYTRMSENAGTCIHGRIR